MALDDKAKERLAELRAAQYDREQAKAEKAEELELEALELAAKLETSIGKRGEDFAIIQNAFGVFAIRKPDAQAIRNWERAGEKQ